MSLVPPHQLLRDQFTSPADGPGLTRRPRRLQLWLGAPALATGGAVAIMQVQQIAVPPLLTAVSIMTGLTFTMALRFWERSVDARKDPLLAVDGERLTLLDRMRTHLVWTVFVGLATTAWLIVMAVFGQTPAPEWMPLTPYLGNVGAATLAVYQVTLVGGALIEFYSASYALRE